MAFRAMEANTASGPADRRARNRYTVQLRLTGTILDANRHTIEGTTLNMSSTGVQFAASEPIPAGVAVRLEIDWPAPENSGVKLLLLAHVVRSVGNLVVAQVSDHRFQVVPKAAAISA